VGSPFKRKRKAPAEAIIFGQFGIRFVRWKCDEARDFRGRVTGRLYAFSSLHPVKPVDKRDMPGLAEDGGRENFEGEFDVKPGEAVDLRPKEQRPPADEGPEEVEDGKELAD